MASITLESNGRRTIQFVGSDGKRRSIRLGKMSQRTAEAIKIRVEHLNAAKISGHALDDETARWVSNLDYALADKLAAVGLVPRRERTALAQFLDSYIVGRTDAKPLTHKKYRTTRDYLVEYFGAERILRDISPGDVDQWRLHLADEGRGENTVRKHIAVAKLFFHAAQRRKLITENPFEGQKSGIQPNPAREFFVTREIANKVLDACPDDEWRLIFVLSRFGGLRCPSEHLTLGWRDVDWDLSRLTVHAPKTEHHPGKATRVIPLFPEIRPYLEAVFDQAEPGTDFVINRYRDTNANLRTQLERIIRRAGLEPWPKIFQNLRSTRQTELEDAFPSHVVCRWLGNSPKVAAKHYLQVTEEHFAKAVQNPVQYMHVSDRKAQDGTIETSEIPDQYGVLRYCTNEQIAGAGLEPARE